MEKDTIESSMKLQIAKETGQHAEIVDKKILSFLFLRIGKKEKEKWMLLIL